MSSKLEQAKELIKNKEYKKALDIAKKSSILRAKS